MQRIADAVILLVLGTLGGLVAVWVGTPMPWLFGALVVSAAIAVTRSARGLRAWAFPQPVREGFVIVIGVLIGGAFSAELIAEIGSVWLSFAAILVFIAVVCGLNYLIFTRLGGYDRVTAFCCSTPGGLLESILLGEKAGGNVRILTVQQFLRISLIITVIPLVFQAVSGEAVGSAAGAAPPGSAQMAPRDWLILAASGAVGFFGARAVGLPAGMLTGPLIASAAVHATGLTHANPPGWLVSVAQLVIGVGLGARFGGVRVSDLTRSLWLGLISVTMMLGVGATFAAGLSAALPQSFDVFFIAFAPGGVTEMGLIALSLGTNPVFVAVHHIFRILTTVMVLGYVVRRLSP